MSKRPVKKVTALPSATKTPNRYQLTEEHLQALKKTRQNAQLAEARAQPLITAAKQAHAEHNAAVAEAVTSMGLDMDTPKAMCLACGLVRVNPKVVNGQVAPCVCTHKGKKA